MKSITPAITKQALVGLSALLLGAGAIDAQVTTLINFNSIGGGFPMAP